MPQDVIIVDGTGREHIFPPGFDPKRAGAIVRQRTGATTDVNVGADASFTVNGQPVAGEPAKTAPSFASQLGTAFSDFGGRVADNLNPTPIVQSVVKETQRPPTGILDVAGKAALGLLYGPLRDDYATRNDRRAAAKSDYAQGNTVSALNNLMGWLLPVVGPMAASFGDALQEGNLAKASADVATVALLPKTIQRGGQVAAGVREGAATMADRLSRQKMVDAIAPAVGQNKVRFGNIANKIAPTLAREPGLSALSRAGMADAIETRLSAAGDAIDSAASTIPGTRQIPVSPVVKGLEAKIREFTRRGVKGEVVSANHAARVATLQRALTEVRALGNLANFENLNGLRRDWDLGGKPKYSPSMTADYLVKQGEANGWADAAGILREHLATKEPTMVAPNAEYSLFKSAADVVRAAEETERVRPRVGRRMFMGAVGGTVGGASVGPWGAVAGMVVGPLVDAALVSGPTTKIVTSRALARLSDALRSGSPSVIRGQLTQMAKTAGVFTPALSRSLQAAEAAALASASGPPATTGQNSSETRR